MHIAMVSLFPEMFAAVTAHGVTGRAVEQGLVDVSLINPRDFTDDKHRTVDDRPYGGGPGMLMKIDPLQRAIAKAKESAGNDARVVYLSPQGKPLNHDKVVELAGEQALILLAGRYEGIDERLVASSIDEEVSIGDYVLSGGELPALVVLDAVSRLLPGALGNSASALEESHLDGLLDYPHYTRPEIGRSGKTESVVPAVLLSGDHEAIRLWRRRQALLRTWLRRPDMLVGRDWSEEDRRLLEEVLNSSSH